MKRDKIERDKTYVGKDGDRKTVTHIFWANGRRYLAVYDHAKQAHHVGIPLDDFAKWAHKEYK